MLVLLAVTLCRIRRARQTGVQGMSSPSTGSLLVRTAGGGTATGLTMAAESSPDSAPSTNPHDDPAMADLELTRVPGYLRIEGGRERKSSEAREAGHRNSLLDDEATTRRRVDSVLLARVSDTRVRHL